MQKVERIVFAQSSQDMTALGQRAGHIVAAGMTKDVVFEPADEAVSDRVDEAYRVKYDGNPYLASMISARARSATVEVTPRNKQ